MPEAAKYSDLYKFKTVIETGFEKWLNDHAELKLLAAGKVPGLENTAGAADVLAVGTHVRICSAGNWRR